MSEILVVLKSEGNIKSALLHKTALNALYDLSFLVPSVGILPAMDEFFEIHEAPLDPEVSDLVVVDRDSQWIGGRQNYLAMGQMTLPTREPLAYLRFNLQSQLRHFPVHNWGQICMMTEVRQWLFEQAFLGGAITAARVEGARHVFADLGVTSAGMALSWMRGQELRINPGHACRVLDVGFEFCPTGWQITDYDKLDPDVSAFRQQLNDRGFNLVPAG